ncbi:MAG TPA: MFS transporter [Pyrinomonadaceae bacterium]|jgi:ACS family hexuronate transporter-like MFS transporter
MSETTDSIESTAGPKSESEIAPPMSAGASATGAAVAALEEINTRIGSRRWLICALLFFAATINYIDRQVIGILKPTLQAEIGWTEIEYSWIVFSFQAAYAIGLLFVGGLMDKIGTRVGSSLSIIVWSIAAMAHALATSVQGFAAARFALGIGEAGYFPGAIKTVSEWFPKKERALATGIFNSGTNVGALATPLIVPWLATSYGWQEAFIVTGAIGFIWLFFWLLIYRKPEDDTRLSKTELAYIRSDPPESTEKIPWARLFPHRQTWAFAIGKFLTDPIWWVYLFWLPDFLNKQHGLDLKNFGLPLAIIYIIADVGSIGGGWLSSTLIKRGWSINAGRKTAMLICALSVVPIVLAGLTANLWVAVLLIGLAAAAHQGWSANIFTLASDMFPRRAVGSVVGIGGMAGSIGGMLIALVVGQILTLTGSYVPIFIIAASAYLVALGIIHLLAPRLEPADV